MSQMGVVKFSYLAYLSQPASDRPIYKWLNQHPVSKIVELGVGDAVRTRRVLELAVAIQPNAPIHYTGIDLFEARPADQEQLTLKAAYRLLRPLPVRSRLVPGDPYMALARVANELPGTDLLIIASDQDSEQLQRAWSLMPRMLHSTSQIFLERSLKKQPHFQPMSQTELATLIETTRRQDRAA
jgi:hypothetical protein